VNLINDNTATYNLLTLRNGTSAISSNSAPDIEPYTQKRLIIENVIVAARQNICLGAINLNSKQ
jgi:hypothetical protein